MPPQLEGMLKQYSLTIQSLPDSAPRHESWNVARRAATNEVVLETALWHQDYPFNILAPEFEGVKAPIGCVATATAIIMKYHEFPKTAKDFKHTWYSEGGPYTFDYGSLNIDYSLLYDDYIYLGRTLTPEEEKAISELMYAAAGVVNMQFGALASGALPAFEPASLREIFNFSPECQFIGRSYFSEDEWRDILREQIDNNMPVLYNGYSETDGHTFVCDGYNSDDFYHINWGWGGYENGFFKLDALNGFDYGNSMIINLKPGSADETAKYSRVWIYNGMNWINEGTDRGLGIQVSVSDIETRVPFDMIVRAEVQPYDYECILGVALVDAEDNVIEIGKYNGDLEYTFDLKSQDIDYYITTGWPWLSNGISFEKLYFTQPIKEDYRIAVYTKAAGEEVWKPVLGTLDAPSSIPVKGNKVELAEVNFKVHGDESKLSFREFNNNFLYGYSYHRAFSIDHGVAVIYIDGKLLANANDFNPYEVVFDLTKPSYDVDVYYYPYSELQEKEIEVTTPGSLSQMISEDELMTIWKLRLTGDVNEEDMYFLSDFPCLMHLDLENAHIVENPKGPENFIPKDTGTFRLDKIWAWGLESCKLPKNLKGFEQYSFFTLYLESLDIPATVDTYEFCSVVPGGIYNPIDFINVQNPIPVELKNDVINYRANTTLFVPVGSKSAYESHASWQGFKEIIEASEPFIGEFVDDDEVRYLILNDCAAVSGVYGGVDMAEIKSAVEYNGKTYPVKYAVTNKLNAPSCLVINNEEAIDFKENQVQSIISTSLNPKFTNLWIWQSFYVPGASNAKDGNGNEANKMWTYKLDKKTGRLLVESNYNEVTIKSISINGMEFAPNANHVYEFEPTDNVTVSVVFEAFGSKPLTTVYDATFNAGLENEEIETGIINAINDDKGDVVVYTISGMKQKMKRSDLKHLPKGVYIINGKKYMVK